MIVAGCLPKADPEKVIEINRNLSMVGPNNLDKIVPAIHSVMMGQRTVSLETSEARKAWTAEKQVEFAYWDS